MSEPQVTGTGLTKYFKAFNNGTGNKLPALFLALVTGCGGTAVGLYSKVEVHSTQINQIQQDIKEIKEALREILRRL